MSRTSRLPKKTIRTTGRNQIVLPDSSEEGPTPVLVGGSVVVGAGVAAAVVVGAGVAAAIVVGAGVVGAGVAAAMTSTLAGITLRGSRLIEQVLPWL
jgi:hypothetical protein